MPSVRRIVVLSTLASLAAATFFYQWYFTLQPELSVQIISEVVDSIPHHDGAEGFPLDADETQEHSTANGTLVRKVLKREWKIRPNGEPPCIVISFYNGNEKRRQALRETWLKWTKGSCVRYRFVGDPGRLPHEPKSESWHPEREKELAEHKIFRDMFFVPGRVGWSTDMTKRTVAFMEFAEDTFDFDYFLMVDTDFFLCYHRLMRELAVAPRTNYAVGKIWCRTDIDSCFDEQFIIMSRDIVRNLVATKKTVGLDTQCATGQSVVLWTQGTGVQYLHDDRIISQPHNNPEGLKFRINVCDSYIGLHHANVTHIYQIWEKEQKAPSNQFDQQVFKIPPLSNFCPYQPSMIVDVCFRP